MVAQRKVRRASAREVAKISFFKQNDVRRDEVLKLIAVSGTNFLKRRGSQMFDLRPHEIEPVREFLERLPRGKEAAKIINGISRFGMRAAADAGLPPLRIPTSAITTSFKAEILDGTHVPGDTYKIALYVAASTIGAATTAYTATNEVANGGGYTTGGMNMAGRQIVTDGTTVILDWTTDPVWVASTITARGCMIYNSTKANRSVAIFDFGSDIASTNGNFTVQLPAPTAAAGAIRIA
jgi:hypothetical protein